MGAVLKIEVLADASKAKQGLDETATAAERMDQKTSRAAGLAAGALAGLGAAAYKSVKAGEALVSAQARVGQVLENQGMDKATERVLANAEAMSLKTGVDRKAIMEGQALLGTFSEIAKSADEQGGAFDRATQASVDLAEAGYGTIESNAVGLGKALQDPLKGMAALTKAGTLTKQEMEEIGAEFERTGDLAAAQNSILEAVEKQVGGVGEATADTSDKMANAWAMVGESIGVALLPALERMLPLVQQFAAWASDNSELIVALGAGFAAIATGIIAVNAAIKAYLAIMKVWAVLTKTWTAIQIALNVAMMLNPIGLIVAAVALLVAAIVGLVLWFKHLYETNEEFREGVDKIWQAIKDAWQAMVDAIMAAWDWFVDDLKESVQAIKNWWNSMVDGITGAWDSFTTRISGQWNDLKAQWQELVNGIKRIWENAVQALARGWEAVKNATKRAMDSVKNILQGIIDKVNRIRDAVRGGFTAAFTTAKRIIGGAINYLIGLVDRLLSKLRSARSSAASRFSFGLFGSSAPSGSNYYPSAPGVSATGTGRVGDGNRAGIVVNVNGAIDPVETANQIRRILDRGVARSGAQPLWMGDFR